MSNKTAAPKLRFPEFQEEWEERKLSDFATLITEKAGENKHTLMSVTVGIGLLTQTEKFGREIAGNSYKNYFVIKYGDFAYNKSATKQYPEGYIAMYKGEGSAAVPNSIFVCFHVEDNTVILNFLDHIFSANFHGAWLRQFITIGARAHGALNVDTDDLMKMPLSFPSPPEQQKIADCLTSLDDLIAAQSGKVATLQAYKKGLLQNLFPAEGESVPRLRFPEFQSAGEWETKPLGEICKFTRGPFGGSLKKEIFVKSGYAVYEQSHAIYQNFDSFRYYISKEKFIEMKRFVVQPDDIIMSCSGTMGKFAIVPKDAKSGVINQALLKLTVKKEFDIRFIKVVLELPTTQENLLSQSAGGAIKNVVSVGQIKELKLYIPSLPEQQRIAELLTALDEQISAQGEALAALKVHKKGLMQGLFAGGGGAG